MEFCSKVRTKVMSVQSRELLKFMKEKATRNDVIIPFSKESFYNEFQYLS